jgi:hypothetical protein
MKKNWEYFLGLFVLILYLFKNAFDIKLFQDDYLFIQITNIKDFWGFINFFNPIRNYSYKPIPTEVFYFIFQKLGNNFFIAHSIVFITYFIGLIYLYKIIEKVTKNEVWAKITTLLYGISFIHVFQLYWLATYQEILMFTLLAVSFYKYLNDRFFQSLIFFVLALFCKETAILYAVFLLFYVSLREVYHRGNPVDGKEGMVRQAHHKFLRFAIRSLRMTFPFLVSAAIFYLIYRYSLSSVTANPNYSMDFRNIKLFANNIIWYMLWALGLPNFLYLYLPTLTSKPIPEFWNLLSNDDIRNYFTSLIVFYSLSLVGLVILIFKGKKSEASKVFIFSLIGFYIFLGPILFFMHKWMVRLTVPLIFLTIFQGYLITRLLELRVNKIFINSLIIFYLLFNYFGITVHEEASNYFDESKVFNNMTSILKNNKDKIFSNNGIFLMGDRSDRLRNTLHDEAYINYFFPNSKIKTYYQDLYKDQPSDTFLIDMNDLFK